jgi:hypothetical protein
MHFAPFQPVKTNASWSAYSQATPAQRSLILHYLRQRLYLHFPTLTEPPWVEALDLFQPDLWVTNGQVTLDQQDLTELVQHLAAAPELPQLDPPIYGPQALYLAQQRLDLDELATRALGELAMVPSACGPWLLELMSQLARGSAVATQVVQAFRWDSVAGRPLRPGLPGPGFSTGSPAVVQQLLRLGQRGS